jgi:hypothetical protein
MDIRQEGMMTWTEMKSVPGLTEMVIGVVRRAVADEREACARIAEEALIDCPDDPQFQDGVNGHARDIADAIRRRGK